MEESAISRSKAMSVLWSCYAVMIALIMSGCSSLPDVAYDHDAKMLWIGQTIRY